MVRATAVSTVTKKTTRAARTTTTTTWRKQTTVAGYNHNNPFLPEQLGGGSNANKVALVMGVANQRSIAWSCVQAFLQHNYHVIITHQDRFHHKVQALVTAANNKANQDKDTYNNNNRNMKNNHRNKETIVVQPTMGMQPYSTPPQILGHLTCDVQTDLPVLFSEQIPHLLEYHHQQQQEQQEQQQEQEYEGAHSLDTIPDRGVNPPRLSIDAIVHCIAHGDLQLSLRQVTWDVYRQAQHISAFSVLETAQCAMQAHHDQQQEQQQQQQQEEEENNNDSASGGILSSDGVSLTALSYLGAVRAVHPYHVMGPAKAALEALIRGMALEFGPNNNNYIHNNKNNNNNNVKRISSSSSSSSCASSLSLPFWRVNAVSAGPIATLSARGGITDFATLQQWTSQASPLGRPVTTEEVAQAIVAISTNTAMTGQVVYVDGGFSSSSMMVPMT